MSFNSLSLRGAQTSLARAASCSPSIEIVTFHSTVCAHGLAFPGYPDSKTNLSLFRNLFGFVFSPPAPLLGAYRSRPYSPDSPASTLAAAQARRAQHASLRGVLGLVWPVSASTAASQRSSLAIRCRGARLPPVTSTEILSLSPLRATCSTPSAHSEKTGPSLVSVKSTPGFEAPHEGYVPGQHAEFSDGTGRGDLVHFDLGPGAARGGDGQCHAFLLSLAISPARAPHALDAPIHGQRPARNVFASGPR